MKTISLLFISMLIIYQVNGQNPTLSTRDSINYVFEALNTTFIPSGILYEKVRKFH